MSLAAFLGVVVDALRKSDVPFMLTGSLASAFYGTPRATQDVDMVIDPGLEQLNRLIDGLQKAGLYVSREAAYEALENAGQFNAIDPGTGWKVDLLVRKDRGFSRQEFERRQPTQLLGVEVSLTSIEDLIIAKLEWSELEDSELQRRDIADLLGSGVPIDRAYIERWVSELGLGRAWLRIREQTD